MLELIISEKIDAAISDEIYEESIHMFSFSIFDLFMDFFFLTRAGDLPLFVAIAPFDTRLRMLQFSR